MAEEKSMGAEPKTSSTTLTASSPKEGDKSSITSEVVKEASQMIHSLEDKLKDAVGAKDHVVKDDAKGHAVKQGAQGSDIKGHAKEHAINDDAKGHEVEDDANKAGTSQEHFPENRQHTTHKDGNETEHAAQGQQKESHESDSGKMARDEATCCAIPRSACSDCSASSEVNSGETHTSMKPNQAKELSSQQLHGGVSDMINNKTHADALTHRLREAGAHGLVESDGTSVEFQKTVHGPGEISKQEQSHLDKEANFQLAVDIVKPKIENDPSSVTKEDAKLLHSRDVRAHGTVEKGGITAEAQHLADTNAK